MDVLTRHLSQALQCERLLSRGSLAAPLTFRFNLPLSLVLYVHRAIEMMGYQRSEVSSVLILSQLHPITHTRWLHLVGAFVSLKLLRTHVCRLRGRWRSGRARLCPPGISRQAPRSRRPGSSGWSPQTYPPRWSHGSGYLSHLGTRTPDVRWFTPAIRLDSGVKMRRAALP